MVNDIRFKPAALAELSRVDVISSLHEDEAAFIKPALKARLRVDPKVSWLLLEIFDRQLVFHICVRGTTTYVIAVEVLN